MSSVAFDASEILVRFFKYALEGLVVAIAAYFFPGHKPDPEEVLLIALVAAATFAVLDLFAPSIGQSARLGAGFGVGANLVGFGAAGPIKV
jgi:ABC-type Co2+ transport system permease subunit